MDRVELESLAFPEATVVRGNAVSYSRCSRAVKAELGLVGGSGCDADGHRREGRCST